MSYQAVKWAMNDAAIDRTTHPSDFAVLVVLAEHASPEGKSAYPSQMRIGLATGLSRRTVQRALARLEGAGVIKYVGLSEYDSKEWELQFHCVESEQYRALREEQWKHANRAGKGRTDDAGGGDATTPGVVRTPGVVVSHGGVVVSPIGVVSTPEPPENHQRTTKVPRQASIDVRSNGSLHIDEDIGSVFNCWVASTRRFGEKMDPSARGLIEAAVARHGLEDVLTAVRSWGLSAWHAGEVGDGEVHNDLEYLIGDEPVVRRLLTLARSVEEPSGAVESITELSSPAVEVAPTVLQEVADADGGTPEDVERIIRSIAGEAA